MKTTPQLETGVSCPICGRFIAIPGAPYSFDHPLFCNRCMDALREIINDHEQEADAND